MRHLVLAFALLMPAGVYAQPKPEVSVSPIECWWKTDRSAIRVGEQFALTLTCAVLDTDSVKVEVDESSLAPSALHLVPFEIVGGQRFRDIHNSPRRFFQYEYAMRVLGEEFFGKEVSLPRLQLSYRVQNSLSGGSALSGREAFYSLRPVPIRVLSLVPADAADIRDAPPDTFGDVDARLFRSHVLFIAAGVALALAALLLVVAMVRTTATRRARRAVRTHVASPWRVLGAAARELSAVQAASRQDGWNSDLAGRAAAALRLAGAVALGRTVSQHQVDRGTAPGEGEVAAGRGWLGKPIVLSAAVTPRPEPVEGPATASRNGGSSLWDAISTTLRVFAAARYSRTPNIGPDGAALDASLAEGQDLVTQLRWRQLFRFRRARPSSPHGDGAKQSWAR